jgi:outer membrane protein assembly factor BamB
MNRRPTVLAAVAALSAFAFAPALRSPEALAAAKTPPPSDRFWQQWRGPLATGEAPRGNPPQEWSEKKNVRWKVEIPGRGLSTPVVFEDVVLLTSAVPVGAAPAPPPAAEGGRQAVKPDVPQQFTVLALGRADGKVRWQRIVKELLPHEGTHKDGSYAAGSILTDGERIYACFGSRGFYALDLKGNVLWETQLGTMSTRNAFGEGSSPALFGDTLVITWDHEGKDFVVALDKKTGKEKWRNEERDEPTSWATPLVIVSDGKPQVVVSATNKVRSFDLATGKQLWEVGGMTTNVIPSPVAADGTLYVMSGFRGAALLAIKVAGAKGDLTGTPAILWSYDKDTPYVPSPLLYKDALYFLKSNTAVLTRFDVRTGKPSYTERLEGLSNVYASPVAAAGRVYVTSREGVTAVVEAAAPLKVLAVNTLEDGIDASPAIVDNELYLRSHKYLYRISQD